MSTSLTRAGRPAMVDIEGRETAMHYGDAAAEYAALRTSALLVDRSHRGRLRFTGPRSAEVLTGLVTNDVMCLTPGQGQYAAVLTPKGKIVSDVRLFALADGMLTDAPPRGLAGWRDVARKYVNPRLAIVTDETDGLAQMGCLGVQSRRIVSAATGLSQALLGSLAPYAHLAADVDGVHVLVARVPDLDVEGYELFVPASARERWWDRLAVEAVPGGLAAWEIARIEAGRPEYGIDIDDQTIPQEANLEELHAISYTKGCYTGQETVARVHFRGHVNRHLRGLRFLGIALPPHLTPLYDDTGKVVGDVRSTALSPRLGAIGLGMVRREILPTATLAARWDGGECPAGVLSLPFPA